MEESNVAPEKFHLSTGGLDEDDEEDVLGRHGGARERPDEEDTYFVKCPLCSEHRKWFYCELCIRNGDLRHSSSTNIYDDDYSKKRSDLVTLQDRLQLLNKGCEKKLQSAMQLQSIKHQIYKKRFRVECLRAIVAEKKREVARKKVASSELLQKNKELKRTIPRYHGKVQEMEDYVLNKKSHLGKKLTDRSMLERNVRAVARQCVRKLVKFIFPLEIVSNTESQTNPCCPSTAMELAEATRTAYVEGHWILQDSGGGGGVVGGTVTLTSSPTGCTQTAAPTSPVSPSSSSSSPTTKPDVQFVIVAPSLPGNGIYKAYSEWFVKNRDTLPNPTVDKDVRINENPAFRMLAALTYTAHLIQVMGFYLDIRFPFTVTAADFCTGFLIDSKFQKRVTRLNANIVHLCYTQGVKLADIRPEQSLRNVTILLEVIGRGEDRIHRHVDPSNMNFNLIDEHFSPILLTDSCTDTDEDDENSLQTEWESLDIVSAPLPSTHHHHHQNLPGAVVATQQAANPLQTASMTMTNAAASIASIFRGLTGR